LISVLLSIKISSKIKITLRLSRSPNELTRHGCHERLVILQIHFQRVFKVQVSIPFFSTVSPSILIGYCLLTDVRFRTSKHPLGCPINSKCLVVANTLKLWVTKPPLCKCTSGARHTTRGNIFSRPSSSHGN